MSLTTNLVYYRFTCTFCQLHKVGLTPCLAASPFQGLSIANFDRARPIWNPEYQLSWSRRASFAFSQAFFCTRREVPVGSRRLHLVHFLSRIYPDHPRDLHDSVAWAMYAIWRGPYFNANFHVRLASPSTPCALDPEYWNKRQGYELSRISRPWPTNINHTTPDRRPRSQLYWHCLLFLPVMDIIH